MGLKPVRTIMQVDSMDEALRSRLWDGLSIHIFGTVAGPGEIYIDDDGMENLQGICYKLWHLFFNLPIDNFNHFWPTTYQVIRKHYFKAEWNEVYDFIEFVAVNYGDKNASVRFQTFCNQVLLSELSAYRFIGGILTRVTSEEEIAEVEDALATPLSTVNYHIKTALELISNRKNPDYRNSIKESISAVESICKLIAKKDKATLNSALDSIKGKTDLHPALTKAFSNLYGYTSDSDGIRHALKLDDDPNLSFEDAKFFLVACSAFINFLIAKAAKAGISL
jgi:hypothetical protein